MAERPVVEENPADVWFIKDISQIVRQLNELVQFEFEEANEGRVTIYGN
jgi:hypothetical protein